MIPHMTARQNLVAQCKLQGVKDLSVIDRILSTVGLESTGKKKAKNFSLGMKQRLAIAIALIGEPDFLFLDEPTLGLDVIARREFWEIIRSLKGKATIILTTHYMEEAEALSDRIAIMQKGKLVCMGTVQELIKKADTDNFEDAFVKLATEEKIQ